MRSALFILTVFSLSIAASRPAAAGIAQPLADINTTMEAPGEPLFFNSDFATLGSSVLYMTDDGIHGLEMWKSDGTIVGTQLVADICPGACGSRPTAVTSTGALVFFSADDGVHGREVWRTDGTAAGTWMVKDIWPGVGGSFIGFQMTTGNGGVYFAADDGVAGAELWKSDGTATGTVLVKDIQPGPLGSQPGVRVSGFGRVLFTADDGVHGREPWISDGTGAGTAMLADINPAGDSTYFGSFFQFNNENLALMSGSFLFTAHDDIHGDELWVTDGTPGGTTTRLGGGSPNELTEMGGTIYFSAVADGEGYELWKTDGTPAGTGMLVAIRPGSGNSSPFELTKVGSRIFFRAFDDAHGQELWSTDGTAAGTALVKDVNPGTAWAFQIVSRQGFLFVLPSGLFFFADDGVHGTSLWRTDGTDAGTALVHDFSSQEAPATVQFYMGAATLGSRYFFRGVSLSHGYELWSTDGTSAGTGEVANVGRMRSSVFLSPFTGAPNEPTSWGAVGSTGSRLLFEANDGTSGNEPWAGTAGPAAGGSVTLLADTLPGSDFSYLREVTPFGASTLFVSSNGSSGSDLWKTDGTPGGTAPSGAPAGGGFTPFAGALVYSVSEAATGAELWRTDGTAGGSALIKDIRPGTESSAPSGFTVSNGALFFAADDGTAGRELWKSDGTEAGTVLVKDIRPGAAASSPGFLGAAGGMLFLAADDGVNGRALWKSDGMPAGTVPVSAVRPGASPLTQEVFQPGSALSAAVGSTLFFVAVDPASGEELWKSDGTAAGTVVVKDIQPGPGGAEPRWLTVAGGRLFFSADDGVHGRELWVSDGTAAGTVMLDLEPGPGSSLPRELTPVGSAIIFSAFETASGVEPWVSDGTAAGTRRLDDIAPGILPSSPSQFKLAGSTVYFVADDGNTGAEPWSIPRNAISPEPLNFYTLTPCRAVDTRSTAALASGEVRTLTLAAGCGIPADAKAVAVNLTVLEASGIGHLTAWPSGAAEPATSVLNFVPGRARANNAILALGGGSVDVQAVVGGGGGAQMLIDVSGYFQ
jgi:ELWxxDGT repeat protein